MTSRWERLLDQKPVPLMDQLLEEVARLVAKDLAGWPPPLIELDQAAARTFAPALEAGRPRPSGAAFAESFRLARFELSHEADAYDDYFRNRRYLERGLSEDDKPALLFLS